MRQHAFDPRVFDVSQQDAAVALFERLRVTFEDVEDYLDDGLFVDDVIVPNDDNVAHISADGDVLIFRRRGLLIRLHADFWRENPRVRLLYAMKFHPYDWMSTRSWVNSGINCPP